MHIDDFDVGALRQRPGGHRQQLVHQVDDIGRVGGVKDRNVGCGCVELFNLAVRESGGAAYERLFMIEGCFKHIHG